MSFIWLNYLPVSHQPSYVRERIMEVICFWQIGEELMPLHNARKETMKCSFFLSASNETDFYQDFRLNVLTYIQDVSSSVPLLLANVQRVYLPRPPP